MPSSGCPLTRAFADSFREDEPQREGMGHGLRDRLSAAQGPFPSIFSITCPTATYWLQRGQVPKFLLSKNSPGICLSEGMTCGGPEMPLARNSCHRHFQLRLDNEKHVVQWNSRWGKGRSDLAEVAAVQRPGRTQRGVPMRSPVQLNEKQI